MLDGVITGTAAQETLFLQFVVDPLFFLFVMTAKFKTHRR